MDRIAAVVIRRRVVVLAAALCVLAFAGVVGGGVAERLTAGGFTDPAAESTRAARLLEEAFDAGDANLLLVATAPDGVDAPSAAADGAALTQSLAAEPDVTDVTSYWTLRAPPLASADARHALVLARIVGSEDEVERRVHDLTQGYAGAHGSLDVAVGGSAEVYRQVTDRVEADLVRAELLAFPLTAILLLVVFGSVVAALLPLAVGALAVASTLAVLQVLTGVTDVSIYALNLTTALGLALAIDYSLFVVSRFREELAAGAEVGDAVTTTVRTAGRTVAFSGGTVAVSLAALLLFPQVFMRSFAYAGIAVVAVAVVGAVVVLPALLSLLGHRVEALRIRRVRPAPVGEGRWHRLATAVMRRPVPVATVVVAVLVLLGLPIVGVEFGQVDDRVLPPGNPARIASDQLRDAFAGHEASALSVVADLGGPADPADVAAYATGLSALDGVARVDAATGSYAAGRQVAPPNPTSTRFATASGTWLAVVPAVEPISPAGERLVDDVRAASAPFDGVLVGGTPAELTDSRRALFDRLPWALGWIVVTTFVLLFWAFGSLLVPLKALVLNTLSLTAMYGAMVWVFQDGNLSGLLEFTATGTLDTTMPILMFCLAFGLSMDYEVFLLSRMKEEHERSGDNDAAVAAGLEQTGRIVTAAAALLAVVFVGFATSGVTLVKLFGLGLALAVVMDATLVRATLVPAFMTLAGDANWWAPRPLRRLHARIGFRESGAS